MTPLKVLAARYLYELGRSREMPGVCSSKVTHSTSGDMRCIVGFPQSGLRFAEGVGPRQEDAVAQARPRTIWRDGSEPVPVLLARAKSSEPRRRKKH